MGLHKNTLRPFRVCKFSSLLLLSMSLYGSDSSLSLWPCIFTSLFPPLGLPTATVHLSMVFSRFPPLLLPGISMGPSSPGGELVPPSQVVHPLTKETNESSRSKPAYGVAVRRPCHQRHQMSPDFCSVSLETLLSISPWPNEPQLQFLRLLDNSSRVKRDSSQGARASF